MRLGIAGRRIRYGKRDCPVDAGGLPAVVLAAVTAATLALAHCNVSGFRLGAVDDEPGQVAATASGAEAGVRADVPAAGGAAACTEPAPAAEAASTTEEPPAPGGDVSPADAPSHAAKGGPAEIVCPGPGSAEASFFFSPAHPVAGAPLRVVAVAGAEVSGAAIEMLDPSGPVPVGAAEQWGGPPYAWAVTIPEPSAGRKRFLLASGDPERPLGCGEVEVALGPRPRREFLPSGAWQAERAWDRRTEDLYSAWVARLFLVEPGAKAGWRPMHQVLHDRKRNILHGHLGLGEDGPATKRRTVVMPDCADTPFFLRAYFSWKLRLPFAFRDCLRGDAVSGPSCSGSVESNLTTATDGVFTEVERFNLFIAREVGDSVHSGTARTLPEDDASDLFPTALSREALRPGVVFVDPHGHVLVVTRVIDGTATRIGTLWAVDAHPDRTVSHKRFSPANFNFLSRVRTGGFKAHRPAVLRRGAVRFMTNAEIAASPHYGNLSLDQYGLGSSAEFYRRVDRLLNPEPLDPVDAYRAKMEEVVELLDERVVAVQVGVDHMRAAGWKEIPMPDGGAIFETIGPWEDYSTPARDLRLLLAMDDLLRFPRSVQEHPDLFRIPAGKSPARIRAELDAEWRDLAPRLSIAYRRSDRSTWTLSLADIVDRMDAFEQAYNPNDCPEVRWGAPPGGEEHATCARRASLRQRLKMQAYRTWHSERRRPSAY